MSIATSLQRILRPDRREDLLLGLAFAFLASQAGALVLAPAARRAAWQFPTDRLPVVLILTLIGGAMWATRRLLAQAAPGRDPFLLPVTFLLAGWGVLAIWRVSPGFGLRQAVWLVVSTIALVVVARSPSDMRWLRRYRYLWLGAALGLIGLTFFLGTNPSGGEPRLWLGCCGLYFQPSEPLRLFLIAFLASFLGDRISGSWSFGEPRWVTMVAPLALVWGLSIAMLFVQRDLGTGSLFLLLLATLLYMTSGRSLFLVAAGAMVGAGAVIGAQVFPLIHSRLESWWNPWIDAGGASYQIVQAMVAYASGGLFGRGPGMGSPGLVPLSHSDLIYAVLVEESGLIGGLAAVALLALLVQRCLRLAANRRSAFEGMLCAGIALAFGLQAVLILGGSVRMLPLTGITVPFLSYGGSSLVTSFVAVGLLVLTRPGPRRQLIVTQRVSRLQAGLGVAWAGIAVLTGWWGLVTSADLAGRSDNARRAVAERYARRGQILDRNVTVLADTVGGRGEFRRAYPHAYASSVVGYDSALHGQAGIEVSMDAWLRGERGHAVEATLASRLLRGVPPDGLSVRLTLAGDLQEAAGIAMADHTGAALVINPRNGEILAMISRPGFDPLRVDEDWDDLASRGDAPLLNRVTQAVYQPGGALAPFLLAWADRVGVARPDEFAEDAGARLTLDGLTLACRRTPESLEVSYAEALDRGCPGPAATLAQELGGVRLGEMVGAFLLDRAPAVELPTAGAPAWVEPQEPEALVRFGVGQSDLLLSPLQVARAWSALAHSGEVPGLRLVDAIQDSQGAWIRWTAVEGGRSALPPEVGYRLFAALSRGEHGEVGLQALAVSGPRLETLAWYVGAWPADSPELVVVVVLEGGSLDAARQVGLAALGLESGSQP